MCGLCNWLVIDYFGLPKMIADGLTHFFIFDVQHTLAEHAVSLRSEIHN
jgi:hypothetical protein